MEFLTYLGIVMVKMVKKYESIGEENNTDVFVNIVEQQASVKPNHKTPNTLFFLVNLILEKSCATRKTNITHNTIVPKYNSTCKYAL